MGFLSSLADSASSDVSTTGAEPVFRVIANGDRNPNAFSALIPSMGPIQRVLATLDSFTEPKAETYMDILGNNKKMLVSLTATPRGFARFPNRAALDASIQSSDAAIVFASKFYNPGPYFDEIVSVYRKSWSNKRPIALVVIKPESAIDLEELRHKSQAIQTSLSRFFFAPYDKNLVKYFEMEDENDEQTLVKAIQWLGQQSKIPKDHTVATSQQQKANQPPSTKTENEASPSPSLSTPTKEDDTKPSFELQKLVTNSFSCMVSVFPWFYLDNNNKKVSPEIA
eukprot:TRINITY_DN2356_c0_g1_i1.p2 TRINITY_DN2356_c0_g1~~TRINITY_DN2356_c0_g1_i1.p2  ORF type:complete len:283 (-),score=79.63 TRINITY_DN2356_c0_g1_i1:1438-2286(-)